MEQKMIATGKTMDLAVEACALLISMGHENIRWWIIGDGPAMGEVRAKVAQLHMENHVTLLGMKSNPYPYIAAADLYVQPSRFESYGLTIAEAMVLEKNIVSTNTDGAKELSRQFPDQILCAIDASSIAHAIRRAIHAKANTASFCGGITEKNRVVMEQLEKLL